jgi:hypothetical protein
MAALKTKLQLDLIEWMNKGEAGDFKSLLDGVEYFRGLVESYAKDASDLFGNKIQGFTALELAGTLLTLAPTETTDVPALQLATGLNLAFTGKQLSTSFLPPDGFSGVSNSVTAPVQVSDTQQDFKDILDLGFNDILEQFPEDVAKILFKVLLSGMCADTIEKGVTKSTWTFNYLQNIPPAYPPSVATGKLL